MSGFTIFALVLLVLAAVGFCLQKNGELSGLGRDSQRGSFRSPHGKLVRTKRLDTFESVPFLTKFLRVGLYLGGASLVVIILCVVTPLNLADTIPVGVDFLVVIAIAVGLTQADVGVWRAFGYAFLGYLLCATVFSLLALFVIYEDWRYFVESINVVTMVFGTLGTTISVALMPLVRTYARGFEDGHVDSIQVTSNSVAAKAFDKLLQPSWQPPKDRITVPKEPGKLRDWV